MNNTLKNEALKSINYVEKLLERFRNCLNGAIDPFTDLELTDLVNILGLEPYELQELLDLTDTEINSVSQFLD